MNRYIILKTGDPEIFSYKNAIVKYDLEPYLNTAVVNKVAKTGTTLPSNYFRFNKYTGFGNIHLDFITTFNKGSILVAPNIANYTTVEYSKVKEIWDNMPYLRDPIQMYVNRIGTTITISGNTKGNLEVVQGSLNIININKRVTIDIYGYWSID